MTECLAKRSGNWLWRHTPKLTVMCVGSLSLVPPMSVPTLTTKAAGYMIAATAFNISGRPTMPECYDYKCEHCGGTFHSDRPDAEAMEEYHRTFPDDDDSNPVRICDHCYHMLMERLARIAKS